ncbi:MAG: hypothetical protein WC490_07320 [Candidatus Margulisiibacteriota bacterium]
MLRNLSKTTIKLKSKRLWLGFYLAPTIAAFSIALVMMPGIRPHAIDSIANSAADVVIGQPDMNSNWINQVGYGKTLLYPDAVSSDGTRLFVADSGNSRVLIYNAIPTVSDVSADIVIGQPDMISSSRNQGGNTRANTLYYPRGVFSDGTRLFIADTYNNRVLIYNTIPTSNNASADVVIGQPDMMSNSVNQGGSAGAATLNNPWWIFVSGGKLFVADRDNNRVLIYSTIPTGNNALADVVVGQPDMISNSANQGGGAGGDTLYYPRGIYSDGIRLFLADQYNNRVLIYDTIPTSNNASADTVIGQPDMTSNSINQGGGVGDNTLYYPRGIYSDGTKLFVVDQNNSRVLVYNSVPTGDNASADTVIGQPDMISNSINQGGSAGPSTLYLPRDVYAAGSRLFVADEYNNRVLVYDSIPSLNNAPADLVIGQPDFTHNQINQSDVVMSGSFYQPMGLRVIDSKLFVADCRNNRVLIFNSIPLTDNQVADAALGQPDMTSNTANNGGVSSNSLAIPVSVYNTGSKFFVADNNNHRILIYNTIPATTHAAADVVIGQSSMGSNAANDGGSVSATGLYYPYSVCSDGTKLFVADYLNNRVLIYNTIPTTDHAAADVVLGQPNMTTNEENYGGISEKSMYNPTCVYTDGTKLFVTDDRNHRVLIYNTIPATNYAAADLVIGQPDMTSNTENNGGISAKSMSHPYSIFTDGARLFIADSGNNRALVYNTIPATNYAAADLVIGQPDMTSNTANNGGISSKTLSGPFNIFVDGAKLFIGDASNNRVLIYDLNTTKPVISDVKINEAGVVSGDAINSIPILKAKLSGSGTVGGVYIDNLKITLGSTLYTYALFDASTDSYNSTTGIFTFKVKNELVPGKYDLKIEVSDYLGNWATYEATDLEVRAGSEAEIIGAPLNYPNPFNTTTGTTKITYNLTVDSNILVYVFDVRGALVWKRSYSTGSMGGKAGYNEVEWDGKDDFGSTVGNGIYPFRIVAGAKVLGRGKIAVLD